MARAHGELIFRRLRLSPLHYRKVSFTQERLVRSNLKKEKVQSSTYQETDIVQIL